MSILLKTTIVVGASALLVACDRTPYESAPVTLAHESGDVTCQLYTIDRVMWDHALTYPETLAKAEADGLCFAEGERRLAAYKAAKNG